jgi:hypothetical protein
MKKFGFSPLLAATLAAALTAPAAWASTLPVGAVITGLYNGAASGLLGLDSNFAAVPGANVTAVNATELEFISADFNIGIDFLTDGSVVVYDNTGLGVLAGSTTLAFDFAGLGEALNAFLLTDVSGVISGAITAQRINSQAVSLTFTDVSFSAPFGSFTAQLGTVPEPASLGLAGTALAALAGLSVGRRRTHG